MRQWLMPIVMVTSFVTGGSVFAGDRTSVCRQPSVVDEMTREVLEQDYYSRVDPTLVTETPTTTVNMVRCQVCVESAPYDMPRFGDRPVRRCLEHGFEVRILHGGFVVRDLK